MGLALHAQICKIGLDISEIERAHIQNHLELGSNEPTSDFDVKYHRLEWRVDHVNDHPILEVNKASSASNTLDHRFIQEDVLQIDRPRSYNEGDKITLVVEHSGSPDDTGF